MAEDVKPVETVQAYVDRMIKERPDDVIMPGDHPEREPIPGFTDLTLGLAQVYGLKWGMIAVLLDLKKKAYEPHIVSTQVGPHVIRGFSRREWAQIQQAIMSEAKDRATKHNEEKSDPEWAKEDLKMHGEELIVRKGCVAPEYDAAGIRQVPTGVVTLLADSIMQASGHDPQPLPPLPLR